MCLQIEEQISESVSKKFGQKEFGAFTLMKYWVSYVITRSINKLVLPHIKLPNGKICKCALGTHLVVIAPLLVSSQAMAVENHDL